MATQELTLTPPVEGQVFWTSDEGALYHCYRPVSWSACQKEGHEEICSEVYCAKCGVAGLPVFEEN
jgi:hypothetical protein